MNTDVGCGHIERATTGVKPIVHMHSPLLGDLTVASRDFH